MVEKDGFPYLIRDPVVELLAINLFDQYARMDGNESASWIEADADTREFFRSIARGENRLIRD